jgi:Zn finger protein HypA/HybF involved in hydrogenase expression
MSREAKGTTDPGYENPNGQVVLRNTGIRGTDFGQYVYELQCKHCGQQYGANGSDIHERKCPVCQGGRSGIEL